MISLSENAVSKIKQLSSEKPGKGLRVKVVGGGCSGLQYRMELDDRQGARQDLRARRRTADRRQEELPLPQRLGTRLLRGIDGLGFQGGQPQRQAHVWMRRVVRRMTTRRDQGVAMVQCPSCARPSEPRLTCPECGAPLGAELDLFAALGLPRKLTLDPRELERIYHEAGRRIHPDRFATASPR